MIFRLNLFSSILPDFLHLIHRPNLHLRSNWAVEHAEDIESVKLFHALSLICNARVQPVMSWTDIEDGEIFDLRLGTGGWSATDTAFTVANHVPINDAQFSTKPIEAYNLMLKLNAKTAKETKGRL